MKNSKAHLLRSSFASFVCMKVQYHCACAESYLSVDNIKKALKHQEALLRLLQQCRFTPNFLHVATTPYTFFLANRRDLLEEYVAVCEPLSSFQNINASKENALNLLKMM